ncbi:MAG: OmpA family protein [Acetobacteraceae bacterium]
MPIALISAAAVPDRHRDRRLNLPLLTVALALLCACSHRAPPPSPPPTAQSLQDGVASLASAMIARAQLPPPPQSGRYPVTIDPWIDATTGEQVATTRLMQTEIETLAPQHFPQLELLPFNQASLERQPLVLLGAIQPVEAPGSFAVVRGEPGAWRIYGVLADLKTGRIAAADSAWVRPQDIDASPVPFYRDSPVWARDESTEAYLRTSAAHTGDPIDPAYRQNLQAEALLTDAGARYDARDYAAALALYRQAAALPQGGHQLRVYNGVYLTTAALGQRQAAAESFGELIGYGLQRQRLAVKFLFEPGSVTFWPDPAISGAYPMWLREIANRTADTSACLRVIGHTSTTGAPAYNDRLSHARAQRVEAALVAARPALSTRLSVEGNGARDPIVGTGRDDATDVLDRRVDFQLRTCGARLATR